MSGILGYVLVTAVLIAIVALAARSLWKNHRRGGHCSGDCGCDHRHNARFFPSRYLRNRDFNGAYNRRAQRCAGAF